MRTRQQVRAALRTQIFLLVHPAMPRQYRRAFTRMAAKVTFRQQMGEWIRPFTRAGSRINAKIRREAGALMKFEADFLRKAA